MQSFDDRLPAEMDPQNEELIDLLRQVHDVPAGAEPEPEQQALALANVRQRLLATLAASSLNSALRLVEINEAPEAPSLLAQKSAVPVGRHGWPRRFALIAASLVVALLVGSMLAIFRLATLGPSAATSGPSAIYVWSGGWIRMFNAQDGALLWKDQVSVSGNGPGGAIPLGTRADVPASNGIIYVIVQQQLLALKASDGRVLWSEDIDGVPGAPTVVEDSTVYLLLWKDGTKGSLEAFDALSGRRLWHYDGPLIGGRFAVVNQVVYGGLSLSNTSANFDLFALNAANGSQLWRVHIDDPSLVSTLGRITVAGGKVYFPANVKVGTGFKSRVYAYSSEHGKFLWRSPDLLGVSDVAVASQKAIYTVNGLYALNAQNGKLLWGNPEVGIGSSVALADGEIFGMEADKSGDYIVEVNANNGNVIARHLIEGTGGADAGSFAQETYVMGALISERTSYMVLDLGSTLSAFDNQTGARLWSAKLIKGL